MTYPPRRHSWAERHFGGALVVLAVWSMLGLALIGPKRAAAQTTDPDEPSLAERYRAARLRILARRHLRREGQVPVLPPERISVPTDSLHPTRSGASATEAENEAFPVRDVRSVQRLERDWFRTKFGDTNWSFLGATPQPTFFDTTRTQDLRARLQAQFGDPTRTLADDPPDSTQNGRAQFEYWFVVNDSIPVQVMDSRGPEGRGLVLAAQRRYRDRLEVLREALLAPLRKRERAPYVDYYYDSQRERWYRTGFDGNTFFLERISRTDVVPGRRPQLDSG